MKKALSFLLALALALPLCPAALAGDPGIYPGDHPGGVLDYLTFPGDPVYEEENWLQVAKRRRDAYEGALLPYEGRDWAQGSVGQCYEEAVYRLLCAENYTDDFEARAAFLAAGRAFAAAESGWYDQNRGRDETYYRISVEKYRAYLIYSVDYISDWGRALVPALDALGMTLPEFFDARDMDRVSQANRDRVAREIDAYWGFYVGEKSRLTVYLDGTILQMDTPVQVRNERTMVPIRALAEALGANVEWVPETRQAVLTRAGRTVTMTLGETTALVDGEPVEMDVAPYAENNRTYFPVRYAAEFFGQTVTWNAAQRRVDIAEDKTAAAEGQEDWALGMGALLTAAYGGDAGLFGAFVRAPGRGEPGAAYACRALLEDTWGIADREALLGAVDAALEGEHDREFREAYKEVKNLSASEIRNRTRSMDKVDQYMWPRTKELGKKWGDKGILAWDLCRAAALVQWGYTAGYVTYSEALSLLEPAAEALRTTFSSWEQVYENFLEGYYWCVREDLGDAGVWDTDLGLSWQYLKNSPDTRTLFNNGMFEAGKG